VISANDDNDKDGNSCSSVVFELLAEIFKLEVCINHLICRYRI
jgi:hypothetical protein